MEFVEQDIESLMETMRQKNRSFSIGLFYIFLILILYFRCTKKFDEATAIRIKTYARLASSRSKNIKFVVIQQRRFEDSRFWFSKRIWRSSQAIYARCCHTCVQSTRTSSLDVLWPNSSCRNLSSPEKANKVKLKKIFMVKLLTLLIDVSIFRH